MPTIASRIRSALVVLILGGLAPTLVSFAQQSPARQDDSTDSPLLRERKRAHDAEKAARHGADADDPLARNEWTRRAMGTPTPESKRRLRREAIRKQSLYPHLMPHGAGQARAIASPSGGNFSSSSPGPSGPAPANNGTTGVPFWIPLGPGAETYEQNGPGDDIDTTVSGRVRKILTHPTDPNTVYVLASGGGLWKTTNFLSDPPTWTPLTDALPTTAGGSVAFGRDPNVLYLGAGDPFDVLLTDGTMVKSTDGGNTWSSAIDLGESLSIRDVAVDSSGAQDVVLVATDVGLFRSADSGATYTQIGGVLQNQQVWSIAKTSAGWLVSAEANTGIGPNAGGTGSLFISTDMGATWTGITNTGNGFSGAGRTTLAVGLPGDAIVYAFAASCNDARFTLPNCDLDQWDLFRSTNGGQDWTELGLRSKKPLNPLANYGDGSNDQADMDVMHDQAYYNQMLLVDPTDSNRNTVYIGGNLTSDKTTDGGNTWRILTDWLNGFFGVPYVHADFHTAAFSLASGNPIVFVGCDGGLFISSDGGMSWSSSKNTGLETFLVYTIASTPTFPAAVLAGFQDTGTRIGSGDTHLFNGSIGGDGTGAGWSQANSNASLGSSEFFDLRRNLTNQLPDLEENWDFAFLNGVSNAGFFTIVATPSAQADPTGLVFFAASTTDLFETTDGGVTWNDFVRFNPPIRDIPHILGIGSDVNHIAVGLTQGYLCFSNNGLNFATYQCPSLNALISGFNSSIANVAWGDNNTLYVSSVAQTPGAVHVAKGTNVFSGGGSWSRADTGLPDVAVYKLKVDPSDPSGNTVLAATTLGVYRTIDGGQNWQLYGAGLPNVIVTDIYMPPDGSFIRIGTYGRGIWELPQISYQGASLNDDVQSCDHDGILDNGEAGHLAITLKNSSGSDLNNLTATVTTTNPNVSFPNGNSLSFPTAAANGSVTASIEVALNGAAGIQQIDFKIAFTDPALGLPSPVTAVSSCRVNYQEMPASSTSDDLEAPDSAWTVAGTAEKIPSIIRWSRKEIGPLQHRWAGVDSDVPADESLVSPVLNVGSAPFSFSFMHRHSFSFFAPYYYDGGVIEISTDGGSSWSDIGASATPGYNQTLLTFTGGDNPLAGRAAYAGLSANYPAFIPVAVNLGAAYAGKTVQVRFRVGSSTFGDGPGWELDNFSFNGLTNTPFTVLAPHSAACSTNTTLSSSAAPSVFGQSVTFTANVNGGLTPATGTVQFADGGSSIGSGTLNGSAQASLSTSTLVVGDHNVTAQYTGDATHASNTSPVFLQTVQMAATTLSVSSSLNPSLAGNNITFTATVNIAAPGAGSPSGTVQFLIDGSAAGAPTPVSSSTATYSTSSLTAGTHTIAAQYSGDGSFQPSSASLAGGEVVNPAAPTITSPISGLSTTNPTVSVSGTASANAVVSLFDGSALVATATADPTGHFSASLTLAIGAHSVTAQETVNDVVSASSNVVSITIVPPVPTITSPISGTSTTNPAVTVSGTAMPNAVVSLFDGANQVATATSDALGNFSGSIVLGLGLHSLTARQTVNSTISAASATVSITIVPALQSITLAPSSTSVAAGLTQPFTAAGHYSDSSTQDLTSAVSWSSSDTTIATINTAGVATGVKAGGPITITATQGSVKGTAQLTVTAASLQSITVAPSSASVAAGLTQSFSATGHYSDSSTQDLSSAVSWTSSGTTIATINTAGVATGVKAGGPVTITAAQGGVKGTAQLTVTAASLQSITVAPSSASVAAGLTQAFSATGHYSDSSTQDLTSTVSWSSSDTTIATINTAGVATGVKAGGPVTITAAQGVVKGTAQLTVKAAFVQLTVGAALSKDNSGQYVAHVTVKNAGTIGASSVQLRSALLNITEGSVVPLTLGDIAAGGTATFTETFPPGAGVSGSGAVLKTSYIYSGGAITSTQRVSLP